MFSIFFNIHTKWNWAFECLRKVNSSTDTDRQLYLDLIRPVLFLKNFYEFLVLYRVKIFIETFKDREKLKARFRDQFSWLQVSHQKFDTSTKVFLTLLDCSQLQILFQKIKMSPKNDFVIRIELENVLLLFSNAQ